jgi:hypothetical protein
MQWENWVPTSLTDSGYGRTDILYYDPTTADPIYIGEVKGNWFESISKAKDQVTAYVAGLKKVYHSRFVELATAPITDLFFIESECKRSDGTQSKQLVQYNTTKAEDGVYYVTRGPNDCQNLETQMDREQEEEAQEELAFGHDANHNGMDDALDLCLAAHPEYRGTIVPFVFPNEVSFTFPAEDDSFTKHVLDLARGGEAALAAFLATLASAVAVAQSGPGGGSPPPGLGAGTLCSSSPLRSDFGLAAMVGGGATFVTGMVGGFALVEAATAAGTTVMIVVTGGTVLVGVALVGAAIFAVGALFYMMNGVCDATHGEPHLVTLDGYAYDMQSVGEFVGLHAPGASLEVQERFSPVWGNTSALTAVAIQYLGDRFEVDTAAINSRTIVLDGATVPVGVGLIATSGAVVLPFTDDSGLPELLLVTPNAIVAIGKYSIALGVAPGIATSGLLGNHDGNASNDLVAADGTPLPIGNVAALLSWYADSWRVSDATSLFTYPPGKTTVSYTDKSFPANVTKLSDFSASQLETANDKCIEAGVRRGVPTDACALDLLVTADDSFAAAAAVERGGVVDPTGVGFDASGFLMQSFDGPVGQNMAGLSYVQVTATTKAVGPLFSDNPYSFALMSVPRHDAATVTSRVLVLGDSVANPVTGTVVVTADTTSTEVSLAGAGAVISGPTGALIVADGSGTTPSGMSYRAYKVTLPLTHFGDAMKVTYTPNGINSINGVGLAIDDVEVALQTSPSQVKASLALPFTAGSAQGSGFGRIETPGAADEYRFAVSAASTDVLVEMGASGPVRVDLVNVATGQIVDSTERTSYDFVWRGLPAGNYSVLVTGRGQATDYSFPVMVVPAAQEFAYQVGQSIGDGTIGGVATAGAGRLETTASMDVYRFTISAAQDGETVVFESGGILPACRSARLMTGHDGGYSLGNPCTSTGFWLEATLSAGEYRVEVPVDSLMLAGAYSMSTYVKQAPQVFTYTLGDAISDRMLGTAATPGAGNLETSASVDVYQFTVATAGTWVFPAQPMMTNCRNASLYSGFSGGTSVGSVCMPGNVQQYALAPGDYRIEVPTFNGTTGTYAISPYLKPAAQVFAYVLGQSVSDGMVGGVAAVGAGNLETSASMDVYTFTVAAAQAGQWTLRATGGLYNVCAGAQLYPGFVAGTSLGSVCSADGLTVTLAAGEYRIEVPANGATGTYTIDSAQRQVFPYVMGQAVQNGIVGGVSAPGAGNLESAASIDVYTFTVTPAQASQTWVFDGSGGVFAICGSSRIVPAAGGASLGSVCNHLEVQLSAGDYRIEVPIGTWGTGSYGFSSYTKPATQVFAYQIGQSVSNGLVGGVAAPGAGNVETSASMDVYTFTVTPAQATSLVVFDGPGGIWPVCNASRILPVVGTTSLGSICGHTEVSLAAGDYRIEVPMGSNGTGTYLFTSYAKPAPQVFAYTLGQSVSDGLVGGVAALGAGNLESTSSMDVYRFTVSAVDAGTWNFDGVGNGIWPRCSDSRLMPGTAGGTSMGSVCSPLAVGLAAGEYRIEVPVGGNGTGTYSFKSSRGFITAATPTILGNPQVGQTLIAVPGAWLPADVTFSYQWLRGGAPISGATANSYVVQTADKGQAITVTVTGSKPALPPVPSTAVAVTPVAAVATSGSLVPLVPSRILDTRSGNGASGPVAPSATVSLQVTGRGGVPATGVAAVVLNVTVTDTLAPGFITVYPSGTTRPIASNVNFVAGQTVPNLAIVKLGTDGKVSLTNSSGGTVSLVADVSGYYLAGSPTVAGALAILDPARLLDTRSGTGASGPVGAGATITVPVMGHAGVPASGVSAVVMNVTVTDTQANGYITVYPSGAALPAASNLNYVTGQTVPNLVMVKVGADGNVKFTNASAGTVSLIADVSAYTLIGTPVVPGTLAILDSSRILDTRSGLGGTGPVVSGIPVSLQVTGRGGVPSTGVAAVVLNVTVVGPTAAGFITAYPSGSALPPVSNLNFLPGQTVPNLVIVKVGPDGKVNLNSGSAGTVQLVADIAGYYLA